MIFKGEKTIFFKSILWIVFFCNLILGLFFESKGEHKILWEKYKVDKSKEDPKVTNITTQDSNFESLQKDEINRVGSKNKKLVNYLSFFKIRSLI